MTLVTKDVGQAAHALRQGKLVAFATETVYGLGADATSDAAVAKVFAAKGRPSFNPLISHLPDAAAAFKLGAFNRVAKRLADAFWPGPLTLVVPRADSCPVSLLASAGLGSVALRVPDHDQARHLLELAGRPVVAPSANPSGQISPTRVEHVIKGLDGLVDVVLDGGPCRVGVESTVIGCLGDTPVLLRPGGVPAGDLEAATGVEIAPDGNQGGAVHSPGLMASHYAPAAPVRLNAAQADSGEALLGFGPDIPEHDGPVLNLSAAGDVTEAAANLFAMLHELDDAGPTAIAVMPIPGHGLGLAINDRLRRAATR